MSEIRTGPAVSFDIRAKSTWDRPDEIGDEVALAFGPVHGSAPAAAATRQRCAGARQRDVVNLSRRSSRWWWNADPVIERLEQGRADRKRLSNCSDGPPGHPRCGRNSENLLRHRGATKFQARGGNSRSPMVDVLRAAVSEIEQYERVSMNVQPASRCGPSRQRRVCVVHLVARWWRNDTSFSSAKETPVDVSGHLLTAGGGGRGGGVTAATSATGCGMGAERWRTPNGGWIIRRWWMSRCPAGWPFVGGPAGRPRQGIRVPGSPRPDRWPDPRGSGADETVTHRGGRLGFQVALFERNGWHSRLPGDDGERPAQPRGGGGHGGRADGREA